MRRESSLPSEFASLSAKVHFVQQINNNEWSSTCPQCGGVQHQNGDFPDRFRMWRVSKYGKPMGWCRSCGYIWTPDRDKPPSREEFEAWRREQIAVEERRKQEAEKALKLLRSERIWEVYHAKLEQYQLAVNTIKQWGITHDYADYWQLGFMEDYTVYNKNGDYHSPAISIPVWQKDGSIANVKVRVLNPKADEDRYRSLYKTGTAKSFVAWRNYTTDTCLVVEGEKKAMVTSLFLRQKNKTIQVVGVPSKTPDARALEVVHGYENVYVCLDPDAREKVNGISALRRMVDMLDRKKLRVVNLPGKVDDMILHNNLDIVDALLYAKTIGG